VDALVEGLIIPEIYWQEMASHVQSCLPEEACGLAGGQFRDQLARVEVTIPVVNQLHSPVRFRMDPAGQLKAFLVLEERGLDLVAIFHSHPTGPELPSPTDLADFYYPGVLNLIFSPLKESSAWQLRAFHLTGNRFFEVPLTRLLG